MSLHIVTPHVAEISVLFTNSTGAIKCENTFYVEDATDAIFDAPEAFATQVWDAWVAHIVPELSSNVVSNGVIFEDQRALPYAGAVYPQTATPGTNPTTGAEPPTNTAFAVKRLTTSLGRSGRGRIFVPVWDTGFMPSQNQVSATYANALVAALTAFQAAVEGGTLPCLMGIVSKQTGGAPRAFGEFTQISSWAYTDLNVDTQRRRLTGRGA